tara:strand:+ start:1080 stop:1283 length:204 start_codon:yes stop_codon:yes gene_type:complete
MPPEKFALSVTAPDPGASPGVPTKTDAGVRGKWIPGFGTHLMSQQKLTPGYVGGITPWRRILVFAPE